MIIQQPRSGYYLACLLYTSDAADERSSVDLGGRRIIKKKKKINIQDAPAIKIMCTTNKQSHKQLGE